MEELPGIFASSVDPSTSNESRKKNEAWLQEIESEALSHGSLALLWTNVLGIATSIQASGSGALAFSITSARETVRQNTISDNEAVRLSAAVWLKHSVRRQIEKNPNHQNRSIDWSTTHQYFEGYLAVAALMEPSVPVGRQLELVVSNLARGYLRDWPIETISIHRTLLALALHCTGNTVPTQWQLRDWGIQCAKPNNSSIAERALRCLKHCLRGWAEETRRAEFLPLLLIDHANSSDQHPSHGIARLRAMAAKAREFRESREQRISAYLSSELLPIAAQAWLKQQQAQSTAFSAVLSCRWLRILSTAIATAGASIRYLKRTTILLSRDGSDGTEDTTQALIDSIGSFFPELALTLSQVAATHTLTMKNSVLAAECLSRFLDSGVFATEALFTQFAGTIAKCGLTLAQALANQSVDTSSPKRVVAIIVALAKILLLEDDEVTASGKKTKERNESESDEVELLCENANSLDISSKPTSGGGEAYQAETLAIGLEDELGRLTDTAEKKNETKAKKSTHIVATILTASGLIQVLVRNYLGATHSELEAYCRGQGESMYARECQAVGSSASWSWKGTASLFSSASNHELSRDAPSLINNDEEDAWASDVRPAGEALLGALCMRYLAIVARGVLEACDALVNSGGNEGSMTRYAALEATYRAIGLVAPFLSSSAQQQCEDTNILAILSFSELWRRHLEPALSCPSELSYPNTPLAYTAPGEAMVRSRCLWLVARCRRSVLFQHGSSQSNRTEEEENAQRRRVLELITAHANPHIFNEPRLALAAIDVSASLLETALERHRSVMLYFERLTGSNSSYAQELVANSAAVIDIVRDFAPTIAERAVACVATRLTQTPEGVLRCLQCTALCLEVASLSELHAQQSEDTSRRAARLALATAVALEISERLVPRVWSMLDIDSFAGLKLRTAVLVLLSNALKGARSLACLEAITPLRRLSVRLVSEVLFRKEREKSLLQDPLAEDALALWLEMLRAEDNQPGTLEALSTLFTRVFSEPTRWGSEHVISMLNQIQDNEALVKSLAAYYEDEETATSLSESNTANKTKAPDDTTVEDEEAMATQRTQTAMLAVAQAVLLRGSSNPEQRQLCAYVALSFLAEQRARERRRELRYLAPALSLVLKRSTNANEETPALAALVLTELLFQIGTVETSSVRALRLAARLPDRHIPAVHNARITEVSLGLVSRAIIAVNGDIGALGIDTETFSKLCIHASKKTLDDLALAAGTAGACPPPRRAILLALAAAAALASSNQWSVNTAWTCLPAILRLWGRCFFDFKRASQRLGRRHSDGGDAGAGTKPEHLTKNASLQHRQRALANYRLPLLIEQDETQGSDHEKPIDAVTTAAIQLRRVDIVYHTALDAAARQALSAAAPSRGGEQAVRQAAQTVTPDQIRSLLLSILLVPLSTSSPAGIPATS